jgi:RND family efflux transporter MFP subunit
MLDNANFRRTIAFASRWSFLLLAAVTGACNKTAEEKKGPPPPVPVRTARAERRTLRPALEVIGTVMADPERTAVLTAAASGLVDRLAVAEGARVGKSDLVVLLDERKARTDLDRAEAALARLIAPPRPEEVAAARSVVAKVEAAHGLAEARLKKTTGLRGTSPDLIPEVQLLDDRRVEQVARADVEAARAQLQLLEKGPREEQRREARVEVAAARLQLDFCRVTAPIAGQVVELKARLGQRADVGTPLATLLDASEVLVQARVPGNRLAGALEALRTGGKKPPARVRCASYPDEVLIARSGWISPQTEGTTGDVPVKLRVPNANGLLRVGMTVRVELAEPESEGVAVPEAALTVNEDGKRIVTAVRDGKAYPTEVELAAPGGSEVRAGGWVRVLKGLAPGDVVAVENGYGLPEGCPVTELPPKESTPSGQP